MSEVVHTVYTDHRIQRPGEQSPAYAPGLRAWRPEPASYAKRNLALATFEWAATTRNIRAMEQAALQFAGLTDFMDDAPVLSAKGAIALQKGAAAEALNWYSRASQLQPEDAEAHFRMGLAERALGRPAEALKQFNTAIRLDPILFDAYVMSAQLHRSKGDWVSYRRTLE